MIEAEAMDTPQHSHWNAISSMRPPFILTKTVMASPQSAFAPLAVPLAPSIAR